MHTAKLVWVTPDAEQLIGKIARVSNPENEDNPNVEKLIRYLIKHKHWSPFEMASMCVEIKTTRAIAPQILRHRSFSFQEFSQRYAVATELSVPDLRRQDLKNRQNSIDDLPEEKVEFLQQQIDNHYRSSLDIYNSMLEYGVAKECARSVLPLSTATRMYMSGTIRSWLHYVDLRGDNGTQLEHMQIARAIGEILADQVPTIARAMWG
jgi:thymidylate synthase (FAD)